MSSSGHLVLLHRLLPLTNLDPLQFDLALHWGTLVAVVVVFRRDCVSMIRGWLESIASRGRRGGASARLAWLILLGNILPILIGAALGDRITAATRRTDVVILTLIVGAVLLLVADRAGRRSRGLGQLTVLDAILIGASQAVAFVPGVSRSGMTIITALFRNINRPTAVRFSFLLSVPIIFAAGVKELFALGAQSAAGSTVLEMLAGFAVSALFGFLIIRFLLRYVERHSFGVFAVYRILLALVMLTVR